ncbi:MAG: hypothetical protein IJ066_11755 [Bacteroidaceae bacterium]|nr:hypothetical protein [Bacteroidaceae bacterium]
MANEIQEIRYQVGEAWKGTYNAATVYGNAAVVQDPTGLSVYRSLKPGNVGHALSETSWWFKIIDLSSIKEAADSIAATDAEVEAHEAARVSAEQRRVSQETARVNAESARIQAEQTRASQESARVSQEQTRVNQEQVRVAQEETRRLAENRRLQAEEQRVSKETQRVNAEQQRALAEQNRVAAETERVDDELDRVANEQSRLQRAEADHQTAVQDNAQMTALVERADADHVQAAADHTTAVSDHTTATADHTTAAADHTTAQADHTTANSDHTRAEGDHTRAESDHATAAADHETYAETVGENTANIAFINKSFGKYAGEREIVLEQAKAGKYVSTDGGETSASGYDISAPITLNAGDILLIPSAQAVPASVSVVARMVSRTYQKVIAYIYTYREDYPELPATATADYDATLVYTAVYDESGDTPTLTGWTRNGETYTALPATREVSEQFYEPLVKQAVSAMPSTGYYIYLSPTAMTVVISGLTATVSGGTALVVGWGIFKNITTNFVGAPGQSVLAQAFAVLFAAIDGLKAQLENLGETKAVSIDFENSPKLCGQDMFLTGDGAPASPNVPTMVGQEYLDVTNNKCYKAFRVTGAISDWVLLN